MKNFAGKIVFIVGGASGAGLGQAKLFGGLGMKVTIVDVRQNAIDTALVELKGLGIDVVGYQVDVTDKKWYTAIADQSDAHWGGPPHLLIHTAGVNSFGPAEASTFQDYEWIVGVDLYGPIYSLCIFVPRILKAYAEDIKAGKTEAHIAFVSSMGAFDGYSTDAPYSVAKAGLNNLAYSYYDALKPYGIGVTVQCPANINSNIGEAVKTRPAELANTGYYVSEGTINMLKSIHATGIDPVRLAEALKFAIENGLPICVPAYGNDPNGPLTSPLGENTFKKFIQWSSLEGMQQIEDEAKAAAAQREEMMKRFAEQRKQQEADWAKDHPGEEMPPPPSFGGFGGGAPADPSVPMETFGQARPDLDWVRDESRKK
ncbi:MAG: SDR family NAD(P)-dependent oxidoreductase [Oscillospiraceae bacterium]|jgi:NAD(P)-dependent dehydrogenase (short-subunit alcohol dehydrogenase family)|nr:SDR family NAD(P)-dependent oxidoreductase [Oscillospiraceae bacterium]